jgi:hypothetical protein
MAKFILYWIPHAHYGVGRTKLASFLRNFRSCGSASFLYLTTFDLFIAHIGESLYGEHTFAEIKEKTVFFKKFALVVFYKKQGFRTSCALRESKICGESEACDGIRV